MYKGGEMYNLFFMFLLCVKAETHVKFYFSCLSSLVFFFFCEGLSSQVSSIVCQFVILKNSENVKDNND